jgi:methylated-DNA-[protein]-cysteine S-methyltransferase
MMTTLQLDEFATPLGDLKAVWHEQRLCSLAFAEHWAAADRKLRRRFGELQYTPARNSEFRRAIAAYFAGECGVLDDIAVDPGGTPFQQSVWQALRRIPSGQTTSYAELARRIAAPTAVRAVGAANGANPIWLIIPCHRAIGSDGSLTGYAGGVERKRWLLDHEVSHGTETQRSVKAFVSA